MGAWPEREAPAEKLASAFFTVEKGMDSSIPFSLRCEFLAMLEIWILFSDCPHDRATACCRTSQVAAPVEGC